MEWIATAPFGLEGVVARELRDLGFANVRAENGCARFTADEEGAFRANLWLRCADRVLLEVGRFEAKTFDSLFESVRALPWERYLSPASQFPVTGNCARSTLMSIRDCQSIIKKAVVERLRAKHHIQVLPETGEMNVIRFTLHGDIAVISLDTSGSGLNRRGYRTWNGEAPLRETLAASLLTLSPWHPGMPLHDPLCGTGTIPIEGAMMALNRAPGLHRSFDMEGWRWVSRELCSRLRSEAEAQMIVGTAPEISGGDIDPAPLELAHRHVKQAGLSGKIDLICEDVRNTRRPQEHGVFLCNPPYGERLSDRKGCEAVARALRELQLRHPGWTLCVFTAFTSFERAHGRRADKRRRLYNGRLECELMTFYGKR